MAVSPCVFSDVEQDCSSLQRSFRKLDIRNSGASRQYALVDGREEQNAESTDQPES
jgi:hypothetical protein